MIEILKKTKHEIIVKQGNSIYSTTPETAPQQVLEKLQEQDKQATKKTTTKTNTTKQDKTKETTKKTTPKKTNTEKKQTKKDEYNNHPSKQ